MKRLLSLIKATFTDNMQIFKIKSNSKLILPLFLVFMLFIAVYGYADGLILELSKYNLEYVVISMFILITFILTFIEGIYKASGLLFNSRDDDLLLSLPIDRKWVLFIRLFKFYVFELIYNSLFFIPAVVCYAVNVKVSFSYYIYSFIMVLLLPVIPIILSGLFGFLISYLSSKFKFKNIAQIIFTFLILIVVMYFSFNSEGAVNSLVSNAKIINDKIVKFYYPARVYINLINEFRLIDLLVFIIVNIGIIALFILLFNKLYFKINSKVKVIKKRSSNNYKIIKNNKIVSLIKKEFNRFINSPVFVVNAGFGLVLYIIGVIVITIKFDYVIEVISKSEINININNYVSTLLFAFVCLTSYMTSISSSLISLEGKSFNILKSLPIKPFNIILSKVYSAVLIMFPFIFIGDILMFIRFKFNILEILLIIITSIVVPFISGLIGILVNLKYPNMLAENDTEVVKQSMSSMISVFIGMFLGLLSISLVGIGIYLGIKTILIIFIGLILNIILLIILLIILNIFGVKEFNKITV